MDIKLAVLIATYGHEAMQRIEAMNLPQVDGVKYYVSWQKHSDLAIPESIACRNDIAVSRCNSIGLSHNRNNLLDIAMGKILLIADDDIRYSSDQLLSVIRTFEQNPEVEYASFCYAGEHKSYPAESCVLPPLPKNFFQSSIEVAIRSNNRTRHLRYNPNYGLNGIKFDSGEDEIFLLDAIAAGVRCRFFPITITEHFGSSTGYRKPTAKVLRGQGAVIFRYYPFSFPARIVLKAARLSRVRKAAFFTALTQLSYGALLAITNKQIRIPQWRQRNK